jgi:magnesium and cobalt exporter, CNNM family
MILIIEIICLIAASFFAGMETGLLSADKLKIYSKKQHGILWAGSADFLLKKPERLLATTLIGTNIAVVSSAVVLTNYLRQFYSGSVAVGGSLILTVIYLLFAEIIPKTFFRRYADSITVRLAVLMHFFFYIFLPVSFLLNIIVRIFMLIMGQKNVGEKVPRSREDFRLLMHLSSRESGFGYDDYRIIDDILDFSVTLASEAMIPLHKYPVFHINTKAEEVIRVASQMNQRFFPCYSKRTDNIVGYIDIQDFCFAGNNTIKQILRTSVFFPEVKPLPDLLDSMVKQGLEVVFLSDEYGGISGLVTHQQIASEIIGTIPGDLHSIKDDVTSVGNNVFIADGTTDLEYFSHVIDVKMKKGTNETLGGYLCEKLGVIPKTGKVFQEGQLKYTILDGDKLAIGSVRVEIIEGSENG